MDKMLLTSYSLEEIAAAIVKILPIGTLKTNEDEEGNMFLTRTEAAKQLKISAKTLDRYVKEEKVKSYRLGARQIRFKKSELSEALRKRKFK